ncbi:T-cell ecto-ADP-ribosyltransferase 2-like [Tupaia chinensis]|nr:T-cell ecto-ADP-ribosyltransferase 2-like [Tupaia chinensis]
MPGDPTLGDQGVQARLWEGNLEANTFTQYLKMPSLLHVTVHFFLLTWWLTQQVTSQMLPTKLDMASQIFDDQYLGCVQEMEKEAPQLIKREMNINKNFKMEWEKAEKRWKKIKNKISYSKKLNDFHGAALVAYTGKIATDFNKAVREFKNSKHFQFYAFHYYLTRALQLLSTGKCYTVYRGSQNRFDYSGKGNVRFGQFTSTSLDKKIATSQNFLSGSGTLFVINTCLGIYIKDFSNYPNEEEVLIPGYEVYQKVTVRQPAGKKYNVIWLEKPQRMESYFNCYYRSAKKPRIQDSVNSYSSGELKLGLVRPSQSERSGLLPEVPRAESNDTSNQLLNSIEFLQDKADIREERSEPWLSDTGKYKQACISKLQLPCCAESSERVRHPVK